MRGMEWEREVVVEVDTGSHRLWVGGVMGKRLLLATNKRRSP